MICTGYSSPTLNVRKTGLSAFEIFKMVVELGGRIVLMNTDIEEALLEFEDGMAFIAKFWKIKQWYEKYGRPFKSGKELLKIDGLIKK